MPGNRVYIKASPFSLIRNTHMNLHASVYLFPLPRPSLMAWSLGHGQRGALLRSQTPTVPLENYRARKRKGSRRFLRQTSPASNRGGERALSAHPPAPNPQSAIRSVPTTPPGFHSTLEAGKSADFRTRAERGQTHHPSREGSNSSSSPKFQRE